MNSRISEMEVFSIEFKEAKETKCWVMGGDLSAAFACSISRRNKENLGQNQWITEPYFVQESECLQNSGQKKSKYCVSGSAVSLTISDDILENRENKDPNSLKPVSQFSSSVTRSKLDFGIITRKSRLMRQRRQSPSSTCSPFGGPWNSDAGCDIYHANGFKDSSKNETSLMIKEACEVEIDDHEFSIEIPQKVNEFCPGGASYEENTAFTQSTHGINKMVTQDGNENSVKGWLEELGFGKFSQMFEMHEVDEDALHLLTFEDLEETGIVAVGPRRKLFTAIQQLKGGQ